MATLDEMMKAGYTPTVSPEQQISNVITGAQDYAKKQSDQQASDLSDQTKLYFNLRQQGYSKEDAAERVNRSYRSTNFIQSIVGGGGNAFQAPTNPDQVEMEQTKAKNEAAVKTADVAKANAEAKKFSAQADYYAAGGPAQRYAHNDSLSPNQMQQRIKYLETQKGMGSQEEDADIAQEQEYLGQKLQQKSGYKNSASKATQAATKIRVKRKSDGQTGTISADQFDPSQYEKV